MSRSALLKGRVAAELDESGSNATHYHLCLTAPGAIMRLTLRTLLAYLDDRLSPANARELGQKISASPFARELAERIKGVVRKRRLAKSEPGQKSIDANLIAEYLDDQLTPELVALIEKEILASDQSLAEVAATHQILGLLADPLEIDENLRKRLYQMDPVAEAEAGGSMTEAEISASEDWKPLAPAPAASRHSPMLVLALMVFGWLALLFLDKNLYRNGGDQAVVVNPVQQDNPKQDGESDSNTDASDGQNSGEAVVASSDPENTEAVTPVIKSASDLAIERAQALANPPGTNQVVAPQPNVADAAASGPPQSPPGEQPNRGNSEPPRTGSVGEPAGATNVAMAEPATGMKDVEAQVPAKAAPTVKPNRSLFADDPSDMLMLSSLQMASDTTTSNDAAEDVNNAVADEPFEWAWASTLEAKGSWNELLSKRLACVASPFVATIGCQSAGWQAKVAGSSLFQGMSGETAGLKLLNGRLVLSRQVAENAVPFVLQVGGRRLLLNPTETMQRLAVEVRPVPVSMTGDNEAQTSLLNQSVPVLVTFAAFGGPCEVSEVGSDNAITLPDGSQLSWTSSSELSGNVIKQAMLAWEWVAVAEGQLTAGQAALHDTLASQLKSHGTVMDAIANVTDDANPVIAEWAIQIPIVQRNVDVLVGLLFQSEQQVVRAAAFYALQNLVRTTSGGRQAVVSLLETRLDLSEMEQAMRMVADISRISLEDRLTSDWLVDMLNSDRLVLREMAIATLTQHLGRNNNYYADEEKNRRDRAVRRWKSEVDRNGGRLIPPQE